MWERHSAVSLLTPLSYAETSSVQAGCNWRRCQNAPLCAWVTGQLKPTLWPPLIYVIFFPLALSQHLSTSIPQYSQLCSRGRDLGCQDCSGPLRDHTLTLSSSYKLTPVGPSAHLSLAGLGQLSCLSSFVFFEKGSHSASQTDLELEIFLPHPFQ